MIKIYAEDAEKDGKKGTNLNIKMTGGGTELATQAALVIHTLTERLKKENSTLYTLMALILLELDDKEAPHESE